MWIWPIDAAPAFDQTLPSDPLKKLNLGLNYATS